MEDQRLRLEQAHGFLVVEAVQDGLVVQRQQLFGGQRVGQGGQVLPTGLAGLGVLQKARWMKNRQWRVSEGPWLPAPANNWATSEASNR